MTKVYVQLSVYVIVFKFKPNILPTGLQLLIADLGWALYIAGRMMVSNLVS